MIFSGEFSTIKGQLSHLSPFFMFQCLPADLQPQHTLKLIEEKPAPHPPKANL